MSKLDKYVNEITHFFHTLTDIPVDKGTLRIQKIKLVVKTAPCRRDGSGVGQHAHATGDLGEITTRNVSGRLIADTELEASRAPVDELDGALRLDDSNGSVDILRHDITTVEKCASH